MHRALQVPEASEHLYIHDSGRVQKGGAKILAFLLQGGLISFQEDRCRPMAAERVHKITGSWWRQDCGVRSKRNARSTAARDEKNSTFLLDRLQTCRWLDGQGLVGCRAVLAVKARALTWS
jgi:hypothetical protein